jgi:hypothetical protein
MWALQVEFLPEAIERCCCARRVRAGGRVVSALSVRCRHSWRPFCWGLPGSITRGGYPGVPTRRRVVRAGPGCWWPRAYHGRCGGAGATRTLGTGGCIRAWPRPHGWRRARDSRGERGGRHWPPSTDHRRGRHRLSPGLCNQRSTPRWAPPAAWSVCRGGRWVAGVVAAGSSHGGARCRRPWSARATTRSDAVFGGSTTVSWRPTQGAASATRCRPQHQAEASAWGWSTGCASDPPDPVARR